jgi:Leucine-rich repeat (LRR) protein
VKNLERLNLANTGLTDLKVVSKLPQLRDLDISSTKVTKLAPLVANKELRRVAMTGTSVDDLGSLTRLPKLCRLDKELDAHESKLLRRYPKICLGGACSDCDDGSVPR